MSPDPLPPRHPEHLPDQVAEPLVRSADWLGAMAELTCSRSGESSCAWYHGTWQYLRLLDLVSSPWWHASFFRNAIGRQSAGRSDIRVLISGCADFSTYALVQGQAADSAKITALDLCPTPLMATSWYARRIGAPVPELLVSDAVEHKRPGSTMRRFLAAIETGSSATSPHTRERWSLPRTLTSGARPAKPLEPKTAMWPRSILSNPVVHSPRVGICGYTG